MGHTWTPTTNATTTTGAVVSALGASGASLDTIIALLCTTYAAVFMFANFGWLKCLLMHPPREFVPNRSSIIFYGLVTTSFLLEFMADYDEYYDDETHGWIKFARRVTAVGSSYLLLVHLSRGVANVVDCKVVRTIVNANLVVYAAICAVYIGYNALKTGHVVHVDISHSVTGTRRLCAPLCLSLPDALLYAHGRRVAIPSRTVSRLAARSKEDVQLLIQAFVWYVGSLGMGYLGATASHSVAMLVGLLLSSLATNFWRSRRQNTVVGVVGSVTAAAAGGVGGSGSGSGTGSGSGARSGSGGVVKVQPAQPARGGGAAAAAATVGGGESGTSAPSAPASAGRYVVFNRGRVRPLTTTGDSGGDDGGGDGDGDGDGDGGASTAAFGFAGDGGEPGSGASTAAADGSQVGADLCV